MIELNETLRDCLIEANNEYPDLGYSEVVIKAIDKYVNITGAPIEVENEEEAEKLLNEAILFLVDCVLFNLIEKGLVEMAGIEDGEMVFRATVEF